MEVKLGQAAFLAVWAPALALAGVVGATALAITMPFVLVRDMRRERRFR
jgi:hypothetical protein